MWFYLYFLLIYRVYCELCGEFWILLLSPWPPEVLRSPEDSGITHFSLVICDDFRGTIEFYLVLFGGDYLLSDDYAHVGFSH